MMLQYWTKSKALFYRKIKKELEIHEGESEEAVIESGDEEKGEVVDRDRYFKLPEGLSSYQTSFLQDPDATLRHLLTAMSEKQGYKEETREASRVCEFQEKPSKSSQKGHKGHLRTNPSHVGSTSEFKKQKKKSTHKSISN